VATACDGVPSRAHGRGCVLGLVGFLVLPLLALSAACLWPFETAWARLPPEVAHARINGSDPKSIVFHSPARRFAQQDHQRIGDLVVSVIRGNAAHGPWPPDS
jgi:hypothetical protein